MVKIVCLKDVHLDEKTAKNRVKNYIGIARKPKAMYSSKTNSWYVCLTEVEEPKVEQARYYFSSKGIMTGVLKDE